MYTPAITAYSANAPLFGRNKRPPAPCLDRYGASAAYAKAISSIFHKLSHGSTVKSDNDITITKLRGTDRLSIRDGDTKLVVQVTGARVSIIKLSYPYRWGIIHLTGSRIARQTNDRNEIDRLGAILATLSATAVAAKQGQFK